MTNIVVGSGPSGIAVATALLARGQKVLMLDGGKELEPDRVRTRERLATLDPEQWAKADRAAWQQPQYQGAAGQTRRFGSDFAMEPAAATFADNVADFGLRSSRAVGGLSNLWGSAILPYSSTDMAGWPISAADLAPHYRALAGFLPAAGVTDDLARLFQLPVGANPTTLAPSPQAETLLARLGRARDRLAQLGLTIGAARQAVAPGCRGCGQCLHGCPWGLIWSARDTLAELRGHPGFSYRPGAVVLRFQETPEGANLTLASGEELTGARIFLAAGVLETARILLASQTVPTPLVLRDSMHGFLPALHLWRSTRRPDRGPFHTLPQAFAELRDPAVSPHLIHAQIYTWNDFFERDLIQNYAHRLPGSTPLWRAMARRLIVAQIFLHSDHSAKITLGLAADGRLTTAIETNPQGGMVFDTAARALSRGLALGGLRPIQAARRAAPPGSSFHAGATLPMSGTPGPGQSDIFGRPFGLSHIHVVDASVLPAIPATTITLSVMANAHRIGATAS